MNASTTAAPTRFTIAERIQACESCIEGVIQSASEWTHAAIVAKGLPADSAFRAEDILSGPTVVIRQLQLMQKSLTTIANSQNPLPQRRIRTHENGQVVAEVFPASGLFDPLVFMGIKGTVRMLPDVTTDDIHGDLVDSIRDENISGRCLVLGAGNVSSIPATDTLNKIIFESRQVVLKLNPVNDYLAPIFKTAFSHLIEHGFLEIATGGSDVGQSLVSDDRFDEIHITGSQETHDTIVNQLNQQGRSVHFTSELGNVTPWIVVPGRYSSRQLKSQVQHIAASITNNASFNCLATKVIVTWDQWRQRDEFLNLLKLELRNSPVRPAYYPGAEERFQRYSGLDTSPDENNALPWTLLTNQNPEERPELFREESFVCVCAETQLTASNAKTFLESATEFVNDRLSGTLCMSLTVPGEFSAAHQPIVQRCVGQLRYGSVCINQWSGLAYGLISPPWGGYPGATVDRVESGIGNVHNTFLLDKIEKTVLEGPLVNFPKPVWFSTHRNSVKVAEALLRLYHRPSTLRLPRLFAAALNG